MPFTRAVSKSRSSWPSCIYPKFALQPITEGQLLTGPLEPTNEWYAVGKIAGMKLCASSRRQYGAEFISIMPTNLYGPGDNYHPLNSHVVAALLRRFHEAKIAKAPQVEVWGTGTPSRDFLFVDDLADAAVFIVELYSGESHLNVGTARDIRSRNLRSSSRKSSDIGETSSTIPPIRTERRENCWTCRN
jgi:GDP-L-fucose synthase